MRTADPLRRLLFHGPLLLAAAAALAFPWVRLEPAWCFVAVMVYGQAAAGVLGVAGAGKGLLLLEALPAFGFGVAHLGLLEGAAALLTVAAGASWGAAILAAEFLLTRGTATFPSNLGYLAACLLAGLGILRLPAGAGLGLALVALALAGNALARRVRS